MQKPQNARALDYPAIRTRIISPTLSRTPTRQKLMDLKIKATKSSTFVLIIFNLDTYKYRIPRKACAPLLFSNRINPITLRNGVLAHLGPPLMENEVLPQPRVPLRPHVHLTVICTQCRFCGPNTSVVFPKRSKQFFIHAYASPQLPSSFDPATNFSVCSKFSSSIDSLHYIS